MFKRTPACADDKPTYQSEPDTGVLCQFSRSLLEKAFKNTWFYSWQKTWKDPQFVFENDCIWIGIPSFK